jgi:hypothetical protein
MIMHTVQDDMPFLPHWNADELAAAVRLPLPPLHTFDFAPPANDDDAPHRPRRDEGFLPAPPLPSRFRIGG